MQELGDYCRSMCTIALVETRWDAFIMCSWLRFKMLATLVYIMPHPVLGDQAVVMLAAFWMEAPTPHCDIAWLISGFC